MTLANWRDLAVVLLAIEAFVIGLVPAAVLFFALRGMSWVIRKVRGVAPTVQATFRKAAAISEQASQRVASPIITTSAALARVRRSQAALQSLSTTLLKSRGEV